MRIAFWTQLVIVLSMQIFIFAGCKTISLGPLSISAPVLIGPIERIGDTKPRLHDSQNLGEFKGVCKKTSMGAASQNKYRSGNSVVTETRTVSSSGSSNTVERNMRQIWKNAGAYSDDIIHIDELTAETWAHNYIFMTTIGNQMEVNGKVLKKQ